MAELAHVFADLGDPLAVNARRHSLHDILNQSQGGMCICRVLGIGAGVSRECFGR